MKEIKSRIVIPWDKNVAPAIWGPYQQMRKRDRIINYVFATVLGACIGALLTFWLTA